MFNQRGFSIYTVISIIAAIALLFILVLPQMFQLDKKENTEQCIKNMKMITDSVREYMDTRQESFVGDIDELDRTVGVKVSLECPSNGVGDKYFVEGDYATGKVTVTCPHHAEESFKDHVLPESGTN